MTETLWIPHLQQLKEPLTYYLQYDQNVTYDSGLKYDIGYLLIDNADTNGDIYTLNINIFFNLCKTLIDAYELTPDLPDYVLDTKIYAIYLLLQEEFSLKFSEIRNIISMYPDLSILNRNLLRRFTMRDLSKPTKGIIFGDVIFGDGIFSTTL
jgi:hypothetical protein